MILKTNDEDDEAADYADLIGFIDVLNNTPASEFATAIDAVFDVDSFLRLMAVTAVLSGYDSYFGRVNNYYLYNRPDTGKFMMLPWDLNMAYGLYHCGRDTDLMHAPVDDPTCKEEGGADAYPLADKILAVPDYRVKYQQYIDEFLSMHFTRERHEAWIAEFDTLIADLLASDERYPHRPEDYRKALSDEPSEPDTWRRRYNILEFVEGRRAYLLGRGEG